MAEQDEAALPHLIARLAVQKDALGTCYAEWGATTIESAEIATSMAEREHAHAARLRALLPVHMTLPHFTPLPCVAQPFATWLDYIAANFLLDGTMTVAFAAMLSSSEAALATLARDVLADERAHIAHADSRVKQLGGEGGPLARGVERAIRLIWNDTLCWLGPQDDLMAEALYEKAIMNAMPDVLRARVMGYVGPIVRAARLSLPVEPAPHGNAWQLTASLPWGRWDVKRWRLLLPGEEREDD